MKHIHRKISVRILAAILVAVAVIVLSALAAHAPAQNQSSLTLESIRTDSTAVFYADHRANGAWFVEAVLPTGNYAHNRSVDRAWFVEAVVPTGNSDIMTENLKSVAATL
jgi:hypothetical protein